MITRSLIPADLSLGIHQTTGFRKKKKIEWNECYLLAKLASLRLIRDIFGGEYICE